MNPEELNKQIKALFKKTVFEKATAIKINEYRKEFIKLHNFDPEFKKINRSSILMLFRMNQRFGFMAFHMLGSKIDDVQLLKI
jgi:hypothetical protein